MAPSPPLILVVDDEDTISELIVTALQFNGFECRVAASGVEAMRALERERPDLVVLDVNLPDHDGFEVCRRMRAYGHLSPVIFLTARHEPEAVNTGFERGGDDYVTKPFRVDELVLRINAVLRRTGRVAADRERLMCGDLLVDLRSMMVTRAGEPVSLSPTELRLLAFLALHRDQVVSRQQIIEHVWSDEHDGQTTLVETYIGYLRRKLDALGPPLIHTVRGSGYVMRTPAAS